MKICLSLVCAFALFLGLSSAVHAHSPNDMPHSWMIPLFVLVVFAGIYVVFNRLSKEQGDKRLARLWRMIQCAQTLPCRPGTTAYHAYPGFQSCEAILSHAQVAHTGRRFSQALDRIRDAELQLQSVPESILRLIHWRIALRGNTWAGLEEDAMNS